MEKQEFIEARRKVADRLIHESHAEVETCAFVVVLTGDDIDGGVSGKIGNIAEILARAMFEDDGIAEIVSIASKIYEYLKIGCENEE